MLSGKEEVIEEYHREFIGFSLRNQGSLPNNNYTNMANAFDEDLHLRSIYMNNKIAEQYSELSYRSIDCCPNGCVAFDGKFSDLDECPNPKCNAPRRDSKGRPQRTFHPIPLIPRLQGMFQDAEMSRSLNRSNRENADKPDILTDKLDGDHARKLCERYVKVDGQETNYKYFTDGRDISLTLGLDGFSFFETLGKHISKTQYTSWTLIALIDSLDPTCRYKRTNILVLGIIPGPHEPWDLNSFLYWIRDELRLLSIGILTWDVAEQEWFLLRAYILFIIGDMPAIATIMCIKGHNGYCPCRACYIIASCGPHDKTLYPALTRPDQQRINVEDLVGNGNNTRTHESFLEDLEEIEDTERMQRRMRLMEIRKELGINKRSILMEFDSLDFPRSFPHDLMHLAGLNTIPNLVLLWTGRFKHLKEDQGTGSYLISEENWKRVSDRCSRGIADMPSEFSRSLPDIADKGVGMTAEGWIFWFTALAPYALDGILNNEYYDHAMDLVNIIRTCMKYEISREEVEGPLRRSCQNWVEDFERSACPPLFRQPLTDSPQTILSKGSTPYLYMYVNNTCMASRTR